MFANRDTGMSVSYGDMKQETYIKFFPTFWECIKLAFKRYKTITVSFQHDYTHHQMLVVTNTNPAYPRSSTEKFTLKHQMMDEYNRGWEDGKCGRKPNPELTHEFEYCRGYSKGRNLTTRNTHPDEFYTGEAIRA